MELTERKLQLLRNLHENDPEAQYATNIFSGTLTQGIKIESKADIAAVVADLNALAKAKYVGAEGRGHGRAWWIEAKGAAAATA